MNKTRKYWLVNIIGDGLLVGLLIFHMETGSAGALNAYLAICWPLAGLALLVGLFGDKTMFENVPKPTGGATYQAFSNGVLIVMTAWAGMPVLAATKLLATLFFESARKREPKARSAGEGA